MHNSTKKRIDHATPRFQLPETSIETNNQYVPPYFIVQLQMPSEPPPSYFYSVEDGIGWTILIYFMITEETCNQLKDLSTASNAVKLFAKYCELSFLDPIWGAKFKVICSCLNLEEIGIPSMISAYNAKPVLIRKTGSLFRGPNYIEKDIHIHKFSNLAKQSIHWLTSRCNQMFMEIAFVIEGCDDNELPETLIGCVAVNKPQQDQAHYLFEDI